MEGVMLHRSPDQAISPYKSHIRSPKKISHPFISRPCETLVHSNFQAMGILKAPPHFLSHSYPPFSLQQPPQPPLLPLPVANPHRIAASRGISCRPPNKKTNNNNRSRDSSLTPKKSKSFNNPKKENKVSPKKTSECVIISSTTPLGPDPKHLPNNVIKVLPFISSGNIISHNYSVDTNILSSLKSVEDPRDTFSGSVAFAISPPPSSLPFPTFSLRPKLSCNAEAAGIDTGATDNLRRLFRLP